ncbi:hypothetical protein AF71_00008380 [Rhizobium sp. 57MFTsu3.2]|jgi:hypothetical protein|nr:hypothetical protein [Rhizobium sp. 57MFTsu3.2]
MNSSDVGLRECQDRPASVGTREKGSDRKLLSVSIPGSMV